VALCVASVAPGLLGYCLTWRIVMWNRPWLQPNTTAFSWGRAHRLLKSGIGFFLIQVIGAVGFNMDTLFIAKGLGAVAATDFALTSRYFSVALVIGNILLAPLWPAYADAASRGELSWAKRTLMLSIAFAAAFGLAITGVLYAVSDWLIPLWLGKGFSLGGHLMATMAGWTALSLVGSAIAMFWNGMHWLRLQCVMAVIFTGVSLPLKLWICRNGTLDQFVMLNILCFLTLEVLPGLLCTFLILKRR
jgi:O-antigen/teichoic acid export membrane protein